jgi:hypothetical protein
VRGKRESKRETRDEKRAENERSEKTFAFCSGKSSKIGLESGTQNQKITLFLAFHLSQQNKKKQAHIKREEFYLSPATSKVYIYAPY